jgi:hypothetical protein
MSRPDILRRFIASMETRDWDATFENCTEDCHAHAPGAGFDVAGREEVKRRWSEFVEQADAHYRLASDPVEYKTLAVAFFEGEATAGGRRLAFPGVAIARFEGDRISEFWGLRG